MLFIPENSLEDALVKAVKHPATAQDFYRLLLEAELLVIGTVDAGADGKVTAGPGSQFQLETGERDGARFLPVFSSLPRMQAFAKKECRYLAMKGRALLELTRGAPVILNPGSEYGREFTPAQVSQLIDGAQPRAPLQASYAQVPLPTALAEGLSDVFDRRGDVAMAWIVQVDDGSGPTFLVGVETETPMSALMTDIQVMARTRVPGLAFDVQKVDRKNPLAFSEAMLKAPPFYPRATRLN